jgi:hypothetical protein
VAILPGFSNSQSRMTRRLAFALLRALKLRTKTRICNHRCSPFAPDHISAASSLGTKCLHDFLGILHREIWFCAPHERTCQQLLVRDALYVIAQNLFR